MGEGNVEYVLSVHDPAPRIESGWRGIGRWIVGGGRSPPEHLHVGEGGGTAGSGMLGGGAVGTVRRTTRRGRTDCITVTLPLLILPKRELFSDASFTLPARLRVGDMMPARWNALVAFRLGDLIAAIGLAAILMLERRLRMRGRSPPAFAATGFACGVVSVIGGCKDSRSTGSAGLDGLVIPGARRPDEKRAE